MNRFLVFMSATLLSFTFVLHSGGTDGKGGHYDNSTGDYHYHHGYEAHDHYDMNGDGVADCPYKFNDKSSNNKNYNTYGNSSGETYVDNTRTRSEKIALIVTVTFGVALLVASVYIIVESRKYLNCISDWQLGSIMQKIDIISESTSPRSAMDVVHINYFEIDETTRKAKEIKELFNRTESECRNKTSEIESRIEKAEMICGCCFCLALTIVLFLLVVRSFVLIFIASAIVSIILCSIAMNLISSRLLKKYYKFQNSLTKYTETTTNKLYSKLLNKVNDINSFVGIPNNIIFDGANPIDTSSEDTYRPYGRFTCYITSYRGKCFHEKHGCGGAEISINISVAAKNFRPCSKCCSENYSKEWPPKWYEYYFKLNKIINEKRQ